MSTNVAAPHGPTGSGIDTPAAPLLALLAQLEAVIARLDDDQYRTPHPQGLSGSIGGHVRHCLDHVAALAAGATSGRLTYDARLRGTPVETSPDAARLEIDGLCRHLTSIASRDLVRPVEIVAALDRSGASIAVASSVGRELAFVVSHTIHHFAVVSLLLRDFGLAPPPGFGYAPSTPLPAASVA